jgi:hypothetical protein
LSSPWFTPKLIRELKKLSNLRIARVRFIDHLLHGPTTRRELPIRSRESVVNTGPVTIEEHLFLCGHTHNGWIRRLAVCPYSLENVEMIEREIEASGLTLDGQAPPMQDGWAAW